ncbi:MAG: NUDIX hydrolase [Candidatus Micrarchaeota archaeon]
MKQHGPWQIKSSTVKYKNSWLSLKEDEVIQPDGTNGVFGVVSTLTGQGVAILALGEGDFVYLAKEFRYAAGKQSLEVVSGGVNQNEEPLIAAKRELKEELGITAGNWVELGLVEPLTSFVSLKVNLFLARELTFGKPEPDSNEKIEMVKIKLGDALKMIFNNEITHSETCALILKANEYLKREQQ